MFLAYKKGGEEDKIFCRFLLCQVNFTFDKLPLLLIGGNKKKPLSRHLLKKKFAKRVDWWIGGLGGEVFGLINKNQKTL